MGDEPATGCGYALRAADRQRARTTMEYSTGSTHLLSAILTKVTGTSTWQFAQDGAGEAARVHAGAVAARSAGHLLRRERHAADAAADGGVRRVVSQSRAARRHDQVVPAIVGRGLPVVPRARSLRTAIRQTYGYGWWISVRRWTACFAWGYGGQYIFVFRELISLWSRPRRRR